MGARLKIVFFAALFCMRLVEAGEPNCAQVVQRVSGWNRLIEHLRPLTSPADLEAFIRAHPEAWARSEVIESARVSELSGRDAAAYLDYFRRMDSTMFRKISQLLPAFPDGGLIVDLGMGTGALAAAYAAAHPHLLVVGVDLEPTAVRKASEKYQLPNLVFLVQNALEPHFPPGTVDAFLESSFSHEIFSYGNPPFQYSRIGKMRALAFRALRNGNYGLRDFVIPNWPEVVQLHLPTAPRTKAPPYGDLSLAGLFLDFAKNTPRPGGIQFKEVASSTPGKRIFEVNRKWAADFLLRVDYTNKKSWESERNEQYVYWTHQQHVESFESVPSARVDFATPLYNDWMIENWWKKAGVQITDTNGKRLPWLASNYLAFVKQIFPGEAQKIVFEQDHRLDAPTWLKRQTFATKEGRRMDVIRVPGVTRVYFPFEKRDGSVFMFLRRSVERPATVLYQERSRLNEAYYGGFAPEAIAEVRSDERTPEGVVFADVLRKKTNAEVPALVLPSLAFENRSSYLVTPGGSDEIVEPRFLDISGRADTWFADRTKEVKFERVDQVLAACIEGAIQDPRVELAAFELARRNRIPFPTWAGADFTTDAQKLPSELRVAKTYSELQDSSFNPFEQSVENANFMDVHHVKFSRVYPDREKTGVELEYVIPRKKGVDTYASIPYFKTEEGGRERIFVGFEARSLPAFQLRGMGAKAAVAPAWRMSSRMKNKAQAISYLKNRYLHEFSAKVKKVRTLGEGYFGSPGQTPERTSLVGVELDLAKLPEGLTFLPLDVLLQDLESIPDLSTRILLQRLGMATAP